MKKIAAFSLLLAIVLLGLPVYAQDAKAGPPGPPDRATIMAMSKLVIEKARYAVLITNGEDGQPQARMLDAFPPGDDMVVWIGTHSDSRKVKQIMKDPHATIIYPSSELEGYVTLFGKATLVTDPKEKEKWWKKEWSVFYSNGYKGDDYILIKFEPTRLEMVCYTRGLINDPKTGLPLTVDLH